MGTRSDNAKLFYYKRQVETELLLLELQDLSRSTDNKALGSFAIEMVCALSYLLPISAAAESEAKKLYKAGYRCDIKRIDRKRFVDAMNELKRCKPDQEKAKDLNREGIRILLATAYAMLKDSEPDPEPQDQPDPDQLLWDATAAELLDDVDIPEFDDD